MRAFLILVVLSLVAAGRAWGNAGITYRGRLVAPTGFPVETSNVRFRLQIRTPGAENCLLYQEIHTRDMTTSDGVFAITINDGTATTPNGEPFSLNRVFQNRGTFSYCTASSSDTNPFTSPCWGGQSTYGTCTFGEGGTCPAWVTADDAQKAGACP